MRKIGIDAVSMTLSDATGVLPPVRFADLYFDFESLATGSLTGSLRGRHVDANTEAGAADANADADADAGISPQLLQAGPVVTDLPSI